MWIINLRINEIINLFNFLKSEILYLASIWNEVFKEYVREKKI
jgi:hypothetical protein